jgi:hypothetical protein
MTPDSLRIDYSDLGTLRPGGGPDPGKECDTASERRGLLPRFLRWVAVLLLLAVLPFFTLVRVSLFLRDGYGLGAWAALAGGALSTVLLLVLYLAVVSLRFGGKGRVPRSLMKGVGILVTAYCGFSLLYLSAGSAKTEEIRSTYTSLHPILRVGVSTLLLADREGVLTATGRTPEDYAAWGLPANEASLHLPQTDGYVHAVDIRTLDRPEWRNRAVEFYFRLVGFSTLRHSGTADHLHVSLRRHPGL